MLFMSLLLTALSRMIKQVIPTVIMRFLADDLLVTYVGEQLAILMRAFDLILTYLHDIGGRVAPKKSLCFSTIPSFRDTLRHHVWEAINAVVPVVTSFRDFGIGHQCQWSHADQKTW